MRAALYARYSTDQQRAASIEDQFRNCRSRVEAEGWTIVATFADEAMSGSDSSRPQYQAMLAAAARGQFEVLLLDDLSRLARDQVESESVIRRLEFQKVRILAVSDGYDSHMKTAMRKVQRGVKNLINEMRLDELREQVHRGLTGQAVKHYWCGGRPYGYRLKPILDASQLDPYGQASRIGTVLEIDEEQSAIVREIFERYTAGASCLTIARELNDRKVPSPGATWKRKVRRCSGWMGSAVRVIVRNPLYTGHVRWNVSQFVRDPDSGSYKRRARSQKEWVEHRDEKLRIVTDEQFAAARARTRDITKSDHRLKSGGKPRYLLSGLLVCDACGANYVIADARSYSCSGYINGRACSNGVRIRREAIEAAILDPIRHELLAPARVEKMAAEMQRYFAECVRNLETRSGHAPRELEELDRRLERLRRRLRDGDPDMAPDELQAAIDRAEAKRSDLWGTQAQASAGARVLSMLPRAAERYRQQIARGVGGEPEAVGKARLIMRELIPQKIRLQPGEGGSLWAEYGLEHSVLLKAAGTAGRGDRI